MFCPIEIEINVRMLHLHLICPVAQLHNHLAAKCYAALYKLDFRMNTSLAYCIDTKL